jgi:hypothetical protein
MNQAKATAVGGFLFWYRERSANDRWVLRHDKN